MNGRIEGGIEGGKEGGIEGGKEGGIEGALPRIFCFAGSDPAKIPYISSKTIQQKQGQ
jgi:hypothetical protein